MTGADFGGVDIDLLADYIGGALTGTPDESAVAVRIADDPAWQAAYASLRNGMAFVSAELGRLALEPMPADLADRLDTLLTADFASATDLSRPTDRIAPTETTPATDLTTAIETTPTTDRTAPAETTPATDLTTAAETTPATNLTTAAETTSTADLTAAAETTSATHLTAATETTSSTDFGLAAGLTAADETATGLSPGAGSTDTAPANSGAPAAEVETAGDFGSGADPTAATDFTPGAESARNSETTPTPASIGNGAPAADAALASDADGEARTDEAGHLDDGMAADRPEPIVDPEPIAADLAAPRVPHLALVRGDGAVGDGAQRVRETQPAPRRGRRLRWAAPIAVAAGVIAFVGFGLDYLAGRSSESRSTDSAAGSAQVRGQAPSIASGQALVSGTNYTHATLGNAPMQPMTAPLESPSGPGRKSVPGMAADVGGALQRLTSPIAIDECLAAITAANAAGPLSVESVDYARFAGSPAVIVRFSADNGRWAVASGPGCGTPAGGAAVLDKVPLG